MNEFYSELLSVFSARSLTSPHAFASISTTAVCSYYALNQKEVNVYYETPVQQYALQSRP